MTSSKFDFLGTNWELSTSYDGNNITSYKIIFPDFDAIEIPDSYVDAFAKFETMETSAFTGVLLNYYPGGHFGGMSEVDTKMLLEQTKGMEKNGTNFIDISSHQLAVHLNKSVYWGVPHIDFHFLFKPMDFYKKIKCHTFPPCLNEQGNDPVEFMQFPAKEVTLPIMEFTLHS